MNGKDIIAFTRQLLQDDQYDADLILQAATWFTYELANNNKLRMFEDSAQLEASAGDTDVPFPDNSIAWTAIYATSPQVYDLSDKMQGYNDFMRGHAGFATATPAAVDIWTQFGNGMRFAAPLKADTIFQIDYVREPSALKSPSSKSEIPARYAELVGRGTKARILEIEEDYDYAQQERDLLDPLMTTFIRNESRGGGKTRPTVIGTGRRANRSALGTPRLGD